MKLIRQEELDELDQLQAQQQAKAKAAARIVGNPLNEGLKPYYIDLTDKPDDDISPDELEEYNKEIKAKTPSWLNIFFSWKGPKDTHYLVLNSKIDYVKLGNLFLENNRMKAFTGLEQGALYHADMGSWTTFKGKECNNQINSIVTATLTEWGAYNSRDVLETNKYITATMYDTSIRKNPFELAKPYLVSFTNGTYNMEEDHLEEPKPENYLLSGHDYDLELSDEPTPATDQYLKASIGDAITYLKEYIGYGFYHSYKPFQQILFLHGDGGEGKSTLLGMLINHFYGSENVSAVPPEDLAGDNSRFEPAQLYGREVNIVSDIAKGYLANTAILKKLSGGEDYTKAEFKGQQNFKFVNHAKMIFSANDLPTFSETVGGFKDRLKVIEFINGDTRHNPGWWDQFDFRAIDDEHSRFVYQCMKLFMEAKAKHHMTETDSMKQAASEWISENDHFGQFIEEACILTPGDNKGESSTDVVAEYKEFCNKNNYSENTSTQAITSKLKPLGIVKKQARLGYSGTGNVKRYMGLKLTKSYLPKEEQ